MSFYDNFDPKEMLDALARKNPEVWGQRVAAPAASDFNCNAFVIRMEDLSSLQHYRPDDRPFRDYTPFPKLDAAERKARAAAIEGRERLVAAWKVLRSGDRDPFNEGCDCGW